MSKKIDKLERSLNFESLYQIYPRHQAKKDAKKAFERINPDYDTLNNMILAANRISEDVKKGKIEVRFVKLLGGWLRDERWEDEQIPEGDGGYERHKRLHEERSFSLAERIRNKQLDEQREELINNQKEKERLSYNMD